MTIQKVQMKNTFGIKSFDIDFILKNIPKNKTLEDQVIIENNVFYSLFPSFLAKNAAGKTSFIKGLLFALKFGKKSTFIKEMIFYKTKILGMEKMYLSKNSNNTDEIFLNEINVASSDLIRELFNQISFSGSNEIIINVQMGNKNLVVEMTPESFFIKMENSTIDVIEFLNKIEINNLNNLTFLELNRKIKNEVTIRTNELEFYNYEFSGIFRDTHPLTDIHELMIKNKTDNFLANVSAKMGFEATKTILKKIDSNINDIELDLESNRIKIFMKESPNIPITSNNLSFGTQKVLEILSKSIPLFENGGIFLVDEIENGLHLSLISLLVSIYSNQEINTAKAQFLITTHNPLIFKQNIIEPFNVYMEENNNFISIKKIKNNYRTYDLKKTIDPKNYYNDLFWIQNNSDHKSSITNFGINKIVDIIAKGKN